MPKFLEQRLRAEYGNNSHAIYGTMNKIGAMQGSKETAKGREMERKHDMKKASAKKESPAKIREIRIEVHHGKDGKITGHTVHHHMMPRPTSKSGAFMEETHHSFPFGAKQHDQMIDHLDTHLSGSASAESAANEEPEDEDEGEEV